MAMKTKMKGCMVVAYLDVTSIGQMVIGI